MEVVLLDSLLPGYDVVEIHSIVVRASAQRVFQAIKTITPEEVPMFRLLTRMRALPAMVLTGRRFSLDRATPVLDQFLRAGFVVLAEAPDQELVVGRIGQFWRISGGSYPAVKSAREFVDFDTAGFAKAALTFLVVREGDRVRLRTETRVQTTDAGARAKFARYWLVVRAGSGLIRRSWLGAIRRHAERPEAEAG